MTPENQKIYDTVVKQFLYLREHMAKKIAEDPEYENTEEYEIAGMTLLGLRDFLEELKETLNDN